MTRKRRSKGFGSFAFFQKCLEGPFFFLPFRLLHFFDRVFEAGKRINVTLYSYIRRRCTTRNEFRNGSARGGVNLSFFFKYFFSPAALAEPFDLPHRPPRAHSSSALARRHAAQEEEEAAAGEVFFFFFFFFLAADGKSAKRFSLSSLFFALSVPPPSSITNRSEHHADHSLFASPVEQPREGVDVADSDHLCLIGIVRILRGGRCWRAGRRDAGPTPAGRHGFVAVAGRGGAIERGGKGDRGKRAWRRREKQSHP